MGRIDRPLWENKLDSRFNQHLHDKMVKQAIQGESVEVKGGMGWEAGC